MISHGTVSPVVVEPSVRVTSPGTGGGTVADPTTTPMTKEEADVIRRTLKDLREKKGFLPPPPGGETAAPANITVKLPADARLWVDSTVCPLTSDTRAFNTPNLQPGRQYYYTLRMEVERDGRTLTTSRRVFVGAGQNVNVDLNDLSVATTVRR